MLQELIDLINSKLPSNKRIRISILRQTLIKMVMKIESIIADIGHAIFPSFYKDGLIDGGRIVWSGQGFKYNISQALIQLNGILLPPVPSGSVTLDAAHALYDRVDLPYVTENGFGVKKGEPSANPLIPQLDDYFTQVPLTPIIVKANTTEPNPGDIFNIDVYKENQEWAGSYTGSGMVVNFQAPNPKSGLYAIEVSSIISGGRVKMTSLIDVDLTTVDTISLDIYLKQALAAQQNIQIYFRDINNVQLTGAYNLQLNRNLEGEYQFAAISTADLNFLGTGTQARSITIRYTASNFNVYPGFFIDNWKLQTGIEQTTPTINQHNQFLGKQGGDEILDEYFHLPKDEYENVLALPPANDIETKEGAATKAELAETNANNYTDDQLQFYILLNEKGQPNGVATLDSNGKLLESQLPDLAITDSIIAGETSIGDFIVDNSSYNYQKGDVIIIDNGSGAISHYLFKGGDKSVLANYSQINATSIPISAVIGLQAILDAKENGLGNPSEEGMVLTSTIAGLRSWVKVPVSSDLIVHVETAADIVNQVLDSTKIYRLEGQITITAPDQIIVPNDDLGLTIDGYGFNISSIFSSSPNHDIFVSPVGGSGDLVMSGFNITTIGTGSKVFNLADKNKNEVGNGTRAIEIEFINFSGCKDLGIIDGYRQFTGNVIGVYGCATGIQLNGVWNGFRLGVTNSFGFGATGTFLKAGPGLIFKNRFFLNLNFDFPTGAVAADFTESNFESNELFQLNGCTAKVNGVFALEHAETLFPNISANSVKSLWTGNTGLPNTALEKLVQKLDTTTTYNIDWFYNTYFLEMTGNTTFTESNLPANTKNTQEIKIYLDPKGFIPTFPAAWLTNLIGTIVRTELNEITLKYIKDGVYFMRVANSLSVYPAPSLQSVEPVSLIPNQTQELVLNGSFFTPATIVSIEGQTINNIEFVNQGKLILSVTTGAIEDEFDITISNGTSVTFPNALIINLGDVFIPTESDWTNLTNLQAGFGEIKLASYTGGANITKWIKEFDHTKNFRVEVKVVPSPLVALPDGGGITYLRLISVVDGTINARIQYNNQVANTRIYCEGTVLGMPNGNYGLVQYSVVESEGLFARFECIDGILSSYFRGTFRQSTPNPITANLELQLSISYLDFVNIKYIELP